MGSLTFLQKDFFIRRSCGEGRGELTRIMLKLHGKDGLSRKHTIHNLHPCFSIY